MERLLNKIRNIPDFPEPGIMYRDITPLVRDPATLRLSVHQLIHPFIGEPLTAIVGMEARGFIFGSLAAWDLGIGFVPLRKPGNFLMMFTVFPMIWNTAAPVWKCISTR